MTWAILFLFAVKTVPLMEDTKKEEFIMKALRALYMTIIYILGAPIMAISIIVMTVFNIVWCVRYEYDIHDLKDFQMALIEGMREGHKKNVYWVRYGSEHYMEKYLEEGLN